MKLFNIKNTKKINLILELIFLSLLFVLPTLETFFYPGVISRYFIFDFRLYLIIGVLGLLFLRSKNQLVIVKKLSRCWSLFTLVLILFETYLVLGEYVYGAPYTLLKYNIHYYRLIYLIFSFGAVSLLSFKSFKEWKCKKMAVFISGLFLILLIAYLRVRNFELFTILSREDGLVENLQFIVLALSSFFSLLIARKQKNNKFLSITYYLIAFIFFVMAGEEISWGQRIFNIETPEKIAEENLQNELNLHNLPAFFASVYRAYIAIGLYGGLAWILQKFALDKLFGKAKKILNFFIPPWFFMPFFLTPAWYIYNKIIVQWPYHEWEEVSELVLLIGILSFVSYVLNQKKTNQVLSRKEE